jgi:glycosyltransferase involved in cell wall biosynthesis
MITGKDPARQRLAEIAVDSVLQQTYTNLELIVINDGDYTITRPADHRLREVRVPKGKVLGELRNIGLDVAKGQFITQTDDDDWYHPERIERQMAFAVKDACVLLEYQIRYSFVSNCSFRYGCKEGIAGSILHPRGAGRYPPKAKAEDSDFWLRNWGPKRILIRNKTEAGLYVRMCHGFNTWNARHIMKHLDGKQGVWELDPAEQGLLLGVLEKYKVKND